MKSASLLLLILAFAHGGEVDKQGGHFNRKDNTYHCHKKSCSSIRKQTKEAYKQADPGTYSSVYNRKDWQHWIDADGDCQNTRQELLISASECHPIQFNKSKR